MTLHTVFKGRPGLAENRKEAEVRTYDFLDGLGIEYLRIDHRPAMTMADCEEIDTALGVKMCKNLFLCNRQQTDFYLLLTDADKKFQTKVLSEQLGVSRLSFGSEEDMVRLLGVTPGSVSVFSLINDKDIKVRLIIDSDLLKNNYIGAHPCVNTSSLRISVKDLMEKIIPSTGHLAETVDL